MKPRKSWREKLADSKDLPRVVPIPEKMIGTWGMGTLVIPASLQVKPFARPSAHGVRQMIWMEEGAAVIKSPLALSTPPHEASHTFAAGIGWGYENRRNRVTPSSVHFAPPDIKIPPFGQLHEV